MTESKIRLDQTEANSKNHALTSHYPNPSMPIQNRYQCRFRIHIHPHHNPKPANPPQKHQNPKPIHDQSPAHLSPTIPQIHSHAILSLALNRIMPSISAIASRSQHTFTSARTHHLIVRRTLLHAHMISLYPNIQCWCQPLSRVHGRHHRCTFVVRYVCPGCAAL